MIDHRSMFVLRSSILKMWPIPITNYGFIPNLWLWCQY